MMSVIPLTLERANTLVYLMHRHHKPVVGAKFALGCKVNYEVIGCVIVGRPVSREIDHTTVAEVTRLVTDGTKNACSFLYSAAARVCREMGYTKIQTYILESEPGTSLLAAGWAFESMTSGGDWNHSWRKGRRVDQPMVKKQRWSKSL